MNGASWVAIVIPLVFVIMIFAAVRSATRSLAADVRAAAVRHAPPDPPDLRWQPRPVEDGLLDLCTGGPLWPVHHDRKSTDPKVHNASITHYRGSEITAFIYTCRQTGSRIRRMRKSDIHQYTVVSTSWQQSMPELTIRPAENARRDATFTEAFFLTDAQNVECYDLPPAVTTLLLTDPRTRLLPLYFEGSVICTWRRNEVFGEITPPTAEFLNSAADLLVAAVDQLRHEKR